MQKEFWKDFLPSYYLEDENTLRILSDEKIVNCVKKYDSDYVKEKVAKALGNIAYRAESEEAVIETSNNVMRLM
ncbi:MAG: hypothetical protein QXU74_02025 [Candidatus Aenigmatarchaeota archaeon]